MKGEGYMKKSVKDCIRGAMELDAGILYFSPIDILKEFQSGNPFKLWKKIKHDLNLYGNVKKRKLVCFDNQVRYTETVDLKDAIRIVMVLNSAKAMFMREFLLDVLINEMRYIYKKAKENPNTFVNISRNGRKNEYCRS